MIVDEQDSNYEMVLQLKDQKDRMFKTQADPIIKSSLLKLQDCNIDTVTLKREPQNHFLPTR